MLKIYLIGFDSPISVLGRKLYEDEKYFVIENEGIRRMIPQKRIFYIEDLAMPLPPAPPAPPALNDKPETELTQLLREATKRKEDRLKAVEEMKVPQSPQIPKGPGFTGMGIADLQRLSQIDPPEEIDYDQTDLVDINVFFSGAQEETVAIQVPRETIEGSKYNPSLAREIFSNAQVQSRMGDFILSGAPKVEGMNVYFETRSLNELKDKVQAAGTMLQTVATAEANVAQGGPSASLKLDDDFVLTGSPFETPAQFSA